MPHLSADKLFRVLNGTPPGGVFFLHGEEEFLREDAATRVIDRHLDPGTRDFNFDSLSGHIATPEEVGSLLATPPMMAEWRVVAIRDAQGLSVRAREAVQSAAKNPPPGLVLVLSAAIPQGSQARFYTDLKRDATSVEFPAIGVNDLPGWLMARASAEYHVELEPEGATALAAAIGARLGTLEAEMKKLVGYVGDRARVTAADVREVVGEVPRVDRWAWFDRVGERRFSTALRELPTLLDAGESGVGLIIGMGAQLLRVAIFCAGGQKVLEAALPPRQRWLAGRVAGQARRWKLAEVDSALTELLRTDRLLKSASLSDRQAMEELLLRLHSRGTALSRTS
ncbi:MAG: DNA polymerase III subunit delta [Gemmatimonadota bacterium]|nr:DNA polymerase III subunit delta [Gemmatimonadota bacterium]